MVILFSAEELRRIGFTKARLKELKTRKSAGLRPGKFALPPLPEPTPPPLVAKNLLPTNGRAHAPMPLDWRPNMDGLMTADMKGLAGAALELEIERFRCYYLANGKTAVDWNWAWRSWLVSPFYAAGQAYRNGNGNGAAHGARDDFLARWEAAREQLRNAAVLPEPRRPPPWHVSPNPRR